MLRLFCVFLLASGFLNGLVVAQDATQIVDEAWHYYRDESSIAVMSMTIHRSGWQRDLQIKSWTKGQQQCIFFIIYPPKDEGNGTLKTGSEMWTYNPKVNRVIKLPPSMMSQSWMGSDFSNNDLAKSASVVEDYTHTIVDTAVHDGLDVWIIDALPKPGAPVVWGKQQLHIRADRILLGQTFYDEDMQPVKALTGENIRMLGGKPFPKVWTMQVADEPNDYTVVTYDELSFRNALSDDMFTIAALKKPWR